jgi:hypothetical protein
MHHQSNLQSFGPSCFQPTCVDELADRQIDDDHSRSVDLDAMGSR